MNSKKAKWGGAPVIEAIGMKVAKKILSVTATYSE